MDVDWDDDKAESNWRKHGVTFEEAISAMDDPLAVTYEDPIHSFEEDRYLTIGMSALDRLLMFRTPTEKE